MGPPPLLPPPPIPPPPSFGDRLRLDKGREEEQPLRGGEEDYDLISGWARSLSVSPRLYPTYGNDRSHAESSSFGSYKGMEASPLLGPRRPSEALLLSVGNGLSPLLGPTTSLGGGLTSMVGGGGYDYSYNGNGGSFHGSSSSRMSHHLSPPLHPATNGSPNLSFSNLLDHNLSLSPPTMNLSLHSVLHHHHLSPTQPLPIALSTNGSTRIEMPPPPLPPAKSPLSHTSVAPHSNSVRSTTMDPAHMLTNAIILEPTPPQPTASSSKLDSIPPEEDPRIRAYAKLEFPTFDMYIQKLSVIIGRRPVVPVVVPASPALGSGSLDASLAPPSIHSPRTKVNNEIAPEMNLDDFIMGVEDDVPVPPVSEGLGLATGEEMFPIAPVVVEITPSSPGVDDKGDETLASISVNASASVVDVKPTIAETEASLVAIPAISSTSAFIEPVPKDVAPVAEAVGVPAPIMTDIDLGPIRAVSRQHARLYFDYELGSWAIEVLGRNGVVVEGKWKAKGEKESLGRRTKIQIAERIFYFVLPTIDAPVGTKALEEAPMTSDDELSSLPGGNDSSSLSEVSDSDIELSPLMTAVKLPSSPLSDPSTSGSITASRSMPAPIVIVPPLVLGRGRRLSAGQRVNYYDNPKDVESFASTSKVKIPYGSGGKNQRVIQSVRSGGKGKGGAGKANRTLVVPSRPPAGKGKGNISRETLVSAVQYKGGKANKGKKMGKSLAQLKKNKAGYDSDEDSNEEEIEFYDEADEVLNEEDFYGDEEEMYEYNEVALPKEPKPVPVVPLLPPKKKASKAPRKNPPKPKVTPLLASMPLPPLPLLPPLPPFPMGLQPAPPHLQGPLPYPPPQLSQPQRAPSMPAFIGPLGPPLPSRPLPLPPLHTAKAPPPNPFNTDGTAIPAGPNAPPPGQITPIDHYALPPALGFNPASRAPTVASMSRPINPQNHPPPPPPNGYGPAGRLIGPLGRPIGPPGPLIGPAGPPIGPGGMPVLPAPGDAKRGRGRPPKNGISAQRPRKPKPKPPQNHSGSLLPGAKSASGSNALKATRNIASPYTLPPIAGSSISDVANVALNKTTFEPTSYPAGQVPLLAADPADLFAKPPYTYASLIAQAVMQAPTSKLTLNGIYDWIGAKWPYFTENQNGWQNSIRHNLTLSRGFIKVPRRVDEPGKGAFWMIDPDQARNFDGFNFRKKNVKPVDVIDPSLSGASIGPATGGNGASKVAARSMGNLPVPPPYPSSGPSARPGIPVHSQQSIAVTPLAGPPRPPPRPPAATSLAMPLPIIIAPIPASYVKAPAPTTGPPPDELTAALLLNPPIVLHEGKLILNPTIFAKLLPGQLRDLELLAANKALEILQAFVVTYFKDQMKRGLFGGPKPAGASAKAATAAPKVVKPSPAPIQTVAPVISPTLDPALADLPSVVVAEMESKKVVGSEAKQVVIPPVVSPAKLPTRQTARVGTRKRKMEEEANEMEQAKLAKLELGCEL